MVLILSFFNCSNILLATDIIYMYMTARYLVATHAYPACKCHPMECRVTHMEEVVYLHFRSKQSADTLAVYIDILTLSILTY